MKININWFVRLNILVDQHYWNDSNFLKKIKNMKNVFPFYTEILFIYFEDFVKTNFSILFSSLDNKLNF